MCEACRSKHKRCLTSRLWKARCVAREQGWDLAWVWAQMGKKTEVHMGEPQQAGPGGSPSALVVLVGLHVDKGKHKAAPLLGPIRRVHHRASRTSAWGYASSAQGGSGRGGAMEVGGGGVAAGVGYALAQEHEEELGRVRREWDEAGHACNLLLRKQDEFRE
ncbi:hypothetical protein C0992_009759 [Termitomyces sp. T32_za158]|nr:hypothetical protein C0992_009759 [Termitomyces sp. T32_za158]